MINDNYTVASAEQHFSVLDFEMSINYTKLKFLQTKSKFYYLISHISVRIY